MELLKMGVDSLMFIAYCVVTMEKGERPQEG
jgi:hypothetical protein